MSEIQQTSTEQLDLIEELFNETPKDESPAVKSETDREVEAVEEETPEDESPQVEEEVAVDYALEVPIVNGEKLTVGQLKDYYQAQQKSQADFIERENALMRQYEEVQQLTQQLNLVPQEVVQQAQAKLQETVKQEFTAMLEVIPQWKDAVEFTKGRDAIYELAKSYGLERDVSKVVDHRVIKMLFDFSRLRGDIKTAKEQVKQVRPNTDPKAKPNKPLTKEAQLNQTIAKAKTGGQSAQLSAIDLLLSSK